MYPTNLCVPSKAFSSHFHSLNLFLSTIGIVLRSIHPFCKASVGSGSRQSLVGPLPRWFCPSPSGSGQPLVSKIHQSCDPLFCKLNSRHLASERKLILVLRVKCTPKAVLSLHTQPLHKGKIQIPESGKGGRTLSIKPTFWEEMPETSCNKSKGEPRGFEKRKTLELLGLLSCSTFGPEKKVAWEEVPQPQRGRKREAMERA